jgi:hypothetical protein
LGEGHTQVVIEAGEMLDLVFATVTRDATSEGGQWQVRHHLCKDEFARIHRQPSQSGKITPECYVRGSNRDQPGTQNFLYPSTCYMSPAL